jgi:hypothetical protein
MKIVCRNGVAIVLLAMGVSAFSEATDPTSADQNESPTELAGESLNRVDLRKVATPQTADSQSVLGERRARSGRRLTLRQKRIFVLGLAAKEKE